MTDFETQLKHFQSKLRELATQMQIMKQSGVNEELLVAYICHKLKISEKKARQIINCYESFYGEFLKGAMAKEMSK